MARTAPSGRYSKYPKIDRSIPIGGEPENEIAKAIIPSLSSEEIIALLTSERVKRSRAASAKFDVSEIEDLSVPDLVAWVGDDPERRTFALDFEKSKEKPRSTLLKQLEQ